jgi:HPt (histidine-containing phosphotransfer) domain-containing protein
MADSEKVPDVLVSELAGDPDMAELVGMFVAGLPDKLAALEKAMSENDLDALRSLAHKLNGAGGGYGSPTITQAARNLEAGVKAHDDMNELRRRFQELAGLCRRASAKSLSQHCGTGL